MDALAQIAVSDWRGHLAIDLKRFHNTSPNGRRVYHGLRRAVTCFFVQDPNSITYRARDPRLRRFRLHRLGLAQVAHPRRLRRCPRSGRG